MDLATDNSLKQNQKELNKYGRQAQTLGALDKAWNTPVEKQVSFEVGSTEWWPRENLWQWADLRKSVGFRLTGGLWVFNEFLK